MAKRHLDVVCGVITDARGRVLVALRDAAADQGGLWEFPGGKVMVGEDMFDALSRELFEEIGIELGDADPWLQVDHEYPNDHVTLYVWRVLSYSGEPFGVEGQAVRWVTLSELSLLEWPDANYPVIEALVSEKHEKPAAAL